MSEERKASWYEQTGTPFDYLDATAFMTEHDADCPHCFIGVSIRTSVVFLFISISFLTFLIAYLTVDGTGYSQNQFSAECPSCEFEITKERLAVLKFVCDVVLEPDNEADKRRGKEVYLPYASLYPKKALVIMDSAEAP